MGGTIIGFAKGVNDALDEIARNVKTGPGAHAKFRTVDDYFNEMIRKGSTSGFNTPKNPKRRWALNRARAMYKEHTQHQYKLLTVTDMINYLLTPGNSVSAMYTSYIGKDPVRTQMAREAVKQANKIKKDLAELTKK